MRVPVVLLLLLALAGAAGGADPPAAPGPAMQGQACPIMPMMGQPGMGGRGPGMVGPGMGRRGPMMMPGNMGMHLGCLWSVVSTVSPAAVAQTTNRIYVAKGNRLVAFDGNLRQVAAVDLPPLTLADAGTPAEGTAPPGGAAVCPMIGQVLSTIAPATLSVQGDRLVVSRGFQVLTYDQSLRPLRTATLPAPPMPPMLGMMGRGAGMPGMGMGPGAAGVCPYCGRQMPPAAPPQPPAPPAQ